MAYDAAGALWHYRNSTGKTLGSRTRIGNGWNGPYITKVEGFRGTGTHGLVARLTDGRLAYYPIRNGTWGTRIILSGGWGTYSIFR